MRTWNKRAVQGSLIRLDQTGMIRRFRIRRNKSVDSWSICIRVLREPRPEDFDNLGFKRQAHVFDTADEILNGDTDGDTLMRDLEVDMLEDDEEKETTQTLDENVRIPPQWTPERLLSNLFLELISKGGVDGRDAVFLRDRVVGPFWRRPTESYLHRLTDDWERTQPSHVRHLAIVRDSRTTAEKKFIHYVYRTYEYFQQAVLAQEATWEGVQKPLTKSKKSTGVNSTIDVWGFQSLNQKDFLRFNGTASLADVRSAIVSRKNGPRWDIAISEEIGYQKQLPAYKTPKRTKPALPKDSSVAGSPRTSALDDDSVHDETDLASSPHKKQIRKTAKPSSGLSLTPEQRIGIGLKPSGRLSQEATAQIMAHRRETGDPTSLPDRITEKPVVRNGHTPLLTREERLAQGLPVKGRLGIRAENKIRAERGLPKLVKKPKRKSQNGEAVFSKQQRIALGFKGDGRLHQHFIDALRKEQEEDIPLEKSAAVLAYRQYLKNEEDKKKAREARKALVGQHVPRSEDDSRPAIQVGTEAAIATPLPDTKSQSQLPGKGSNKRKAGDATKPLSASKRQRSMPDSLQEDTPAVSPPQVESRATINTPIEQVDESSQTNTAAIAATTTIEPHESLQKVLTEFQSGSNRQNVTHPVPSSPLVENRSDNDLSVRSSPGLYVYASAKRKAGRGRPRNACIMVLKSSRLVDLPGFGSEADSGYGPSMVVSMGPLKAANQSVVTSNEKEANTMSLADTRLRQHSHVIQPPHKVSQLRSSSQPDLSANVMSEDCSSQKDEGHAPPIETNGLLAGSSQAAATASPTRTQQSATIESVTVNAELHGGLIGESSVSTPIVLDLPPVVNRTSTNPSAQVTKPSYQSLSVPAATSKTSTPAAPRLNDLATTMTTTPTDPCTPSDRRLPEPAAVESTSLVQGVVGPITDCTDFAIEVLKKSKGKATGPRVAGSQRIFRRDIILEILKRCGYVFPLHGELWRPFSALWDERHGKKSMPKPENSTVFDALDDMIREPKYGLKTMVFMVNAKNESGSKKRKIVTPKDMSHNHPAVKRLAYGMANHPVERSGQYYPPEARALFEHESLYVPLPEAPKDHSVTLEEIYPWMNKNQRMRDWRAKRKEQRAAEAKQRSKEVEKPVPRRRKQAEKALRDTVHEKRARLASLNDKKAQWRWAPVRIPVGFMEAPRVIHPRGPSPANTDSSDDVSLITLRPSVSDTSHPGVYGRAPLSSELEETERSVKNPFLALRISSFTDPFVLFHATTGTFSTDNFRAPFQNLKIVTFTHPVVSLHAATGTFCPSFDKTTLSEEIARSRIVKARARPVTASKPKKRVRIDSSTTVRPTKRARIDLLRQEPMPEAAQEQTLDDEFVYSTNEDSDVTSSEEEEEEDMPRLKSKRKPGRPRSTKRQEGKNNLPAPTLLQRLTGLTGDPNDPIYKDPKLHQKPGYGRPWSEKKKKQSQANKLRKEREYAEALDRSDEFKKLCLTLVLASSMSGEDGVVNWSIVEKVYVRDKFFDLLKVKKLWAWMQRHMATQLAELVNTVQSKILEAYEAKKLPTIDDPEVYDWDGLVRWSMRTCTYRELPLPLYREALAQFSVNESRYITVDRTSWYGKKIADATRTHLQLQLAFVAPLHTTQLQTHSVDDKVLKARSWTRANIATPQSVYNATQAHEKLKMLGEDVLARVVSSYVQAEQLKMRKLKRQLPGRNYTFVKKFAKSYKRPFELEDFMVATTVKKELDTTFASQDPRKRFYSISRCEEDGSVMAIMSLVADGQVKLVPQVPPVNNEFGAPLPRLSKWGFCEGDYIHRAIDRNRLFWDTHVVPTSSYQCGSPLHPLPSPAADWPSLPEPPLPGKHDPDALLPIWSSIDGQVVTWPWWYRILNLVLQPLYLQPGATATDVLSHCAEHSTELFEVELVLGWLESVGAVSNITGGGYQVTASFWAAFGDRLLDMEDDWFGEYVKRKNKMTAKQQWRDKYNLRYASMQKSSVQPQTEQAARKTRRGGNAVGQRIAKNPKAQYSTLQQAMLEPVPEAAVETGDGVGAQAPVAGDKQDEHGPVVQEETSGGAQMIDTTNEMTQDNISSVSQPPVDVEMVAPEEAATVLPLPEVANAPAHDQDVEMVDVPGEGDDEDAEGEVDDAME